MNVIDVRERLNEMLSLRSRTWEKLDRKRTVEEVRKHLKVGSYGYRVFGIYILDDQSDVTLCLDDGVDATFVVSFLERGGLHQISVHEDLYTALDDFFVRMNREDRHPRNIVIMKE